MAIGQGWVQRFASLVLVAGLAAGTMPVLPQPEFSVPTPPSLEILFVGSAGSAPAAILELKGRDAERITVVTGASPSTGEGPVASESDELIQLSCLPGSGVFFRNPLHDRSPPLP